MRWGESILNSPFAAPACHWHITDEGITDEPVERYRRSSYFILVLPPDASGVAQKRATGLVGGSGR